MDSDMDEPIEDSLEVSRAGLRFDLMLALILTLCTAFWGDLFGRGPTTDDYFASVLTSIALVMPLALRRTHPVLMVGLMAVAGALQTWLVGVPTWSLVAIPVASYSVARAVAGRASRLVVVVGALGSLFGPLRWVGWEPGFAIDADLSSAVGPVSALCLAWVVIPYLLGRRDRETVIGRRERMAAARRHHESELRRREQQTRMAEARVRNEIARELHDVVAHSLSVIIVQADGGKALARKDPVAATQVLDTISQTGRDALGEMRRIVGVLRVEPDSGGQADYRPAPGLADIPDMVAKAGGRVKLSITGTQPAVSAALGVTVYRVVQEALTNFLKHAGPRATATVAIIHKPGTITVEVANTAPPEGDAGGNTLADQGPGYGLRGMHERVTAMGGRLTARPNGGGGWVVRAVLPVDKPSDTHGTPAIGHNGADPEQNSEWP